MKKYFLFLAAFFGAIIFTNKALAQAPTVQAYNTQVTYKYASGTAATVTWTRGNGQYCLVVFRRSSSSQSYPVSGSTANYSASASYGNGSSLGNSDNFVVYNGTGTGVYVYNLAPNTIYDVYVYEYNIIYIFGNHYYYNTSTSSAIGFSTLAAPPANCGSISGVYYITDTTATVYFNAGSGDGRLITLAPSSASANNPSNGYYYTPSSTYGSGAALGGAYSVYDGASTSGNILGLSGATNYTAREYEYDNGTYPTYGAYNYNTKNYISCGSYTFSTANMPPTINSVASATVCQNTYLTTAALSGLGDGSIHETQNLTISASSSNTALLSNSSIYVSYANPNTYGYLYMYPTAGQSGTTVITVTVNDGWTVNNITTTQFTLTVLPIPGTPGAISGASPICAGLGTQTYSVAAVSNATGYTWQMPAGFTVTAGAGTNTISVTTTTASTSGTMTVYATNTNGCGNGPSGINNIQVDAQPADPEAGPDQPVVCGTSAALNATAATNPDAGVWTWYSGTPVPSIGTTTVNSTSISGLTGPNNTYKYIWTVTRAGSVCPSKTDTVAISTDWNNISCQPVSAFDYSPKSDVANNKVCVNTAINFSDLSVSANSWQWDFNYTSGSPVFTSTLQNPAYTYTSTGTYTVYLRIWSNATSQYYNSTQAITVIDAPATPGTIFGTNSGICAGSSNQYVYSISSVTNATGYSWSVPPGAHIDANPSLTSIAVSYHNIATSGNILVSASNSCGTSGNATYSVTINPLPYSSGQSIVGPASVCQGQNAVTYSISPINAATSYIWSDLNGTQTATSQNTFTMNVSSSAAINGQISVIGSNSCGTGDTVVMHILVNPLPSNATSISGPANANLCPNSGSLTYVASTISNATTYHWTLPAGASITGGNGTDTVKIAFSGATHGGNNQISVYGSNACGAGDSAFYTVLVSAPLQPKICMVTVDSASTHNIIYWDKTTITGADSFRIYREDVTNIFKYIGALQYNSLSEYHDYGANPNITTKRYKISAVDSCGNESALSPYHNTIYIIDNGAGQFSWNPGYTIQGSPNPVNTYALMRDDNNTGAWHQVDSTAGTQNTVVDPNYSTYVATANWYVETHWNINCVATARAFPNSVAATIVRSKSNITNNRGTTGIKNNVYNDGFNVYPNPTGGKLTVTFTAMAQGKTTIRVTSLLGAEVYSETFDRVNGKQDIDLSNYQCGTYLVQVITGNSSVTKRVVKN
jgi:hypothetical protein